MLRVLAKQLLCRFKCIPEFCKDCGRDVEIIWTADEWIEVTGSPFGVLCVRCFDVKASELGYLFRWKPSLIAKGNSE